MRILILITHFLLFNILEGHVNPITKLSIYSERCSGSNYVYRLILENTHLIQAPLCHKHFPPWFNLPRECWSGLPQAYDFENTDDTLFILVVRDPYEWSKSFHRKPWCASYNLRRLAYSDFIRAKWITDPSDPAILYEVLNNPWVDKDPDTLEPFGNIFKLREAKLKNMLEVQAKVLNFLLINYEEARDHPKELLEKISVKFGIELKEDFNPIYNYKGDLNQGIYHPKKYSSISSKDISFINSQLNKSLEESVGYRIKTLEP